MPVKTKNNGVKEKKVTRYTYDNVTEPRTPETGHTALLPADEQVVTLPMDNGWSKAINVGKLPDTDDRPVVVDMEPAADPVLFWSGRRNSRQVPILPLQRNEIVTESRIAQIIERARHVAAEKTPQMPLGLTFAEMEKELRESEKTKRVEFYCHDEGWKNKLICGDSLYLMESLLHYEDVRSHIQMIYIDPPYGIEYDSNFQQRTDSIKNDQADQADGVLTIKAFRDIWTLGIHSYLSYLAERFYLCRELLSEIIHKYALAARVQKRVYPHLFRHQIITFLTKKGIISPKLQLLSGHAEEKSLAIYRDLALTDVSAEYEEAMKTFPVR
jgi:hypothetical protein